MVRPKARPKTQKRMPKRSSLWPSTPRKFTCERSGSVRLASPPADSGARRAKAAAALNRSREALAAHFFANWTHACTDIQPPELDLAIGTLLIARSHIKETAFVAGFAWFVKNLRGLRARAIHQG